MSQEQVETEIEWPVEPQLPLSKSELFNKCQWIQDEPSRDDSCKCMAPTEGRLYCMIHSILAYPINGPGRSNVPMISTLPKMRSK